MESKNVISLQDGTVLEPTKEELSQAGLFAGREDIIGYELKGLEPGMPFYLVQADLHHSASFYHSTLLLGIFGKDSQARTCCRKNRSYHSYPYSQGKPEIVTFDQNAGQYHGEVQIDCYNGYYRFE